MKSFPRDVSKNCLRDRKKRNNTHLENEVKTVNYGMLKMKHKEKI